MDSKAEHVDFWNLETRSVYDSRECVDIMITYINSEDYPGFRKDANTLIEKVFKQYHISSSLRAKVRAAQIRKGARGRDDNSTLLFAYEIEDISKRKTVADSDLLEAIKVILRFGCSVDSQIIERLQSSSEVDFNDYFDEYSFLCGKKLSNSSDNKFLRQIIKSINTGNVSHISAFIKSNDSSSVYEYVVHWLVHMLVYKPGEKKRIQSPKRIRRIFENLNEWEHQDTKVAMRLQELLSDDQANNDQIGQVMSLLPTLSSRLLELLSLAVLVKWGRNVQPLKLAYFEAVYVSEQRRYIDYDKPDIFLAFTQFSSVEQSSVSTNKYLRSLLIAQKSGRPLALMALNRIRNVFTKPEHQKKVEFSSILNDFNALGVAVRDLRGGIAKVMQLGVATEGIVPDEIKGALYGALDRCHAMSTDDLNRIFKRDFNALPNELFESWDDRPFACGSIGQVHDAVTKEGRRICVKVKYEGIENVVESDFDSLSKFLSLVPDILPAKNTSSIITEWKRVTLNECDYLTEVENINTVGEVLKGGDYIVSKTYDSYCSASVITMDKVDGFRFNDFIYCGSQEDRNKIGLDIMRSSFELLRAGYFRMDVHQGNYIISGKKLGIIDLANVMKIDSAEKIYLTDFLQAILNRNVDQMKEILIKEGWVSERSIPAGVVEELLEVFGRPFLTEKFSFDYEYSKEVFIYSRNISLTGLRLPVRAMPSIRLFWSIYGLLGALNAEGNWMALVHEIFPSK